MKHFQRLGLTLLSLFLAASALPAQPAADTARQEKLLRKSSLIAVPIIFYTPETRWAGGGAVLYSFRFRGQGEQGRLSQVQLGGAYTQERQVLLYLPFQLFLQNEAWQAYGELGYYRYIYQFFGLGNDTRKADQESYDAIFPRLRLNLLRRVAPGHYLGLRYWWDDYRIPRTDEGGILSTGSLIGSRGGVISGAGLVWNYEGRDQIFYPSKGFWTEAELFFNQRALGSDFNFSRFSLDAAAYFSQSPRRVLALNAWLVFTQGEVPFQQLAFIGGPKKMRGYFEGRLRDKHLWMAQAEYRLLLPGRFGAAAFAGLGAVSPDVASFFRQGLHYTYGAGLRFRLSKNDHINLRLDVAGNGQGEFFPYLTVREAF